MKEKILKDLFNIKRDHLDTTLITFTLSNHDTGPTTVKINILNEFFEDTDLNVSDLENMNDDKFFDLLNSHKLGSYLHNLNGPGMTFSINGNDPFHSEYWINGYRIGYNENEFNDFVKTLDTSKLLKKGGLK